MDGNLFCYDYLDKMFSLQRSQEMKGIAGSGFSGTMEEENKFMDSVVHIGGAGTGREITSACYFGAHGESLIQLSEEHPNSRTWRVPRGRENLKRKM
jgi:hypothetical protein